MGLGFTLLLFQLRLRFLSIFGGSEGLDHLLNLNGLIVRVALQGNFGIRFDGRKLEELVSIGAEVWQPQRGEFKKNVELN